ncbi:hypothetical protein C8J57DRAFT_1228075 [Mycena rebaudengoi]|nr:hypothetical protein C8J57DRAFT_1228075 [Mycena rebaudengoi]
MLESLESNILEEIKVSMDNQALERTSHQRERECNTPTAEAESGVANPDVLRRGLFVTAEKGYTRESAPDAQCRQIRGPSVEMVVVVGFVERPSLITIAMCRRHGNGHVTPLSAKKSTLDSTSSSRCHWRDRFFKTRISPCGSRRPVSGHRIVMDSGCPRERDNHTLMRVIVRSVVVVVLSSPNRKESPWYRELLGNSESTELHNWGVANGSPPSADLAQKKRCDHGMWAKSPVKRKATEKDFRQQFKRQVWPTHSMWARQPESLNAHPLARMGGHQAMFWAAASAKNCSARAGVSSDDSRSSWHCHRQVPRAGRRSVMQILTAREEIYCVH